MYLFLVHGGVLGRIYFSFTGLTEWRTVIEDGLQNAVGVQMSGK